MTTANGLPAGYTARAIVRDDVNATAALLNTCFVAEVGTNATDETEILNDWGTPGFELDADTRAVEAPDGTLVAYAELWNVNDPRVRPFLFARVLPEHRNRGLGSYLLHWAEARSRMFIPEVPTEARVSLRSSTPHVIPEALNLFEDQGFQHIRTFYRMEIDMDAPPPASVWPEGITVRVLRDLDDDLRAAVAANDDAFKDHWGYLPVAFEKWKHWIDADPEFDRTLYFLAMDGDEIAGTCFCRPKMPEDAGLGWVDDLGVRRAWRRRGLGEAFLRHAFGEFWRRGTRRVGLGVDATSLTNATRLYEKVGMRVTRESRQYEKELRPGIELSTQNLES